MVNISDIDESWKFVHFGMKDRQKHLQAWVFALFWVLASSSSVYQTMDLYAYRGRRCRRKCPPLPLFSRLELVIAVAVLNTCDVLLAPPLSQDYATIDWCRRRWSRLVSSSAETRHLTMETSAIAELLAAPTGARTFAFSRSVLFCFSLMFTVVNFLLFCYIKLYKNK